MSLPTAQKTKTQISSGLAIGIVLAVAIGAAALVGSYSLQPLAGIGGLKRSGSQILIPPKIYQGNDLKIITPDLLVPFDKNIVLERILLNSGAWQTKFYFLNGKNLNYQSTV